MMRVVVMISGSGSNLAALIAAQQTGELEAEIVAVVCDQPKAGGITRALHARIPTLCVPLLKGAAREPWALLLANLIAVFAPDVVLMAGWMRIMPAVFVARFAPNLLNQHPALLPDDAGDTYTLRDGRPIPAIRGAHAVADALRLAVPITGCTVHRVTPLVDVGPVLARIEVPILPDDDQASLHERIKTAERRMIVTVINQLARDRGSGIEDQELEIGKSA